jgi:phosphoesterase RecJ-like protein
MRNYKRLKRYIETSKKIAIVSHINPEADAIGSSLALFHFITSMKKEVVVINKTGVPETLKFLPGSERIKRSLPSDVDLYIILDTASLKRTGFEIAKNKDTPPIINIDHHVTNEKFGNLNLIDPEASATAVIIFRFFRHINFPMTEEIMINIYAGMFEDTGGFSYQNTNAECFRIATFMVKNGLDPSYVARMLKEEVPARKYLLLGEALSTLKIYPKIKTATMFVRMDMKRKVGASWEDTDGFVDYPKSIKGIKVGVLFNEREDGTIKVSMRSKEDVDISWVAREFGGGGHKNAAGFELKKEEVKNIKKYERELFKRLKMAMQ